MSALPIEAVPALLLKATLLLTFASVVHALMVRRTSAASRHLVWTFAVVGVLVLPVLSVLLPAWKIPVRVVVEDTRGIPLTSTQPSPILDRSAQDPAPIGALEEIIVPDISAAPVESISLATAEPAPGLDPISVLLVLYLVGVLVLLVRLTVVERLLVRRIERSSEPVQERGWGQLLHGLKQSMGVEQPVVLLRSRGSAMPMTWGTRRPTILIPADADSWADDRRRAVLLHELAHVARRDCLTQTLAALACALYWFHPSVWWAAKQLRIERELACDDRVLAAGTRAPEYAGHLLEVARTFRAPRVATAVAMARPSQLEMRMLAALDHTRARTAPGRRAIVLGAVLSTVLLLPLAAIRADAASDAPGVSGASQHGAPAVETLGTLGGDLTGSATSPDTAPDGASDVPTIAGTDGEPDGPDVIVPASAPALPGGEWSIRLARAGESPGNGPIVHVALRAPGLNTFYVPLTRLEGLTAEQIASDDARVRFHLREDAGTFSFDGSFRGGRGTGRFDFAPDPAFAEALVRRGLARPTPEQQFSLARHDVDLVFLDELAAQEYARPTTAELVGVGMTGVDLRYLRDMGALGYRLGTLDALVRLSNHSIGPDFVREANARAGRKLSADELMDVRMRRSTTASLSTSTPLEGRWVIHRVQGASADLELFWTDDTNWRRWIASSEFRGVSTGDLLSPTSAPVSFRIEQDAGTFEFEGTFREGRGTGEFRFRPNRQFVSTLRSLGVEGVGEVTDHQLKNLAYGGMSAADIREFGALGFAPLTLRSAVDLAIFRVTPDYTRAMQALGVSEAHTVRGVIDLRHQGVTPEFVRRVREAGYPDVPTSTLVEMRRRGIEETARREGLRREP